MHRMHRDDEGALLDLARATVAGDRAAAEQLLAALQDDCYRLALRMLGHPQDAEDAAQEILLVVLTQLGSFRGESSLRTWVFRIASRHPHRLQASAARAARPAGEGYLRFERPAARRRGARRGAGAEAGCFSRKQEATSALGFAARHHRRSIAAGRSEPRLPFRKREAHMNVNLNWRDHVDPDLSYRSDHRGPRLRWVVNAF